MFQCSSASRKFLNSTIDTTCQPRRRAFQCSSASRKFLNRRTPGCARCAVRFQCSSASRKFLNPHHTAPDAHAASVSVLFSEPKIPQSTARCSASSPSIVSVLFSEPKIPQFGFVRLPVTLLVVVSVLFSEPKIPQSLPAVLPGAPGA